MGYDQAMVERRLKELPQGLLDHCQRVSKVCQELAQRFGGDVQKASFAGLVHDLARALSDQKMLARARSYGLKVEMIEEQMPLLLHGPVAAEMLRREARVADEELLQAVSCHTTGQRDMSVLDKILFIGDKIEPGKYDSYPGVETVAEIARRDLDAAILEFLNRQILSLVEKGWLLHPAMIAARDSLLLNFGKDAASIPRHKRQPR